MDLVSLAIKKASIETIFPDDYLPSLSDIVLPILRAEWRGYTKLRKKDMSVGASIHHIGQGRVVCSYNCVGIGRRINTRIALLIEAFAEDEFQAHILAEKRLNKKAQNEKEVKLLEEEYSFLKEIKHKYILSPDLIAHYPRGKAFNYSFLEGLGTGLLSYIEHIRRVRPNNRYINRIFICIMHAIYGLDHLHKEGFIHRDFKLDNILIFSTDSGLTVGKLGDFDCRCKEVEILDQRRAAWEERKQLFDEPVHEALKKEAGIALEPSLRHYKHIIDSHPLPGSLDRSKIDDVMLYLSEWEAFLKEHNRLKGTACDSIYRGNLAPETLQFRLVVKQSDIFGVGTAIQYAMALLGVQRVWSDKKIKALKKLSASLTYPDYRERPPLEIAAIKLQTILAM
jgi:serine/threonine protein kinase